MSNSRTTLDELVSQINKDASTLSGFYFKVDAEPPSFSLGAPATFPPGGGDDVVRARSSLIWAAKQLQMLALGPTEGLQWLALTGALDTASLRWLYHFNVPATVPIGSSVSFDELVAEIGCSQDVLTRVLRHAMTNNVFMEPEPGLVAHTSFSRLLADADNPIRGVVGHQTEVVFPALAHMIDAHDKYGTEDDCVTHAPFNEAFGTDMRALDWVASDPVRSARLAASMKGGAKSGQFSVEHTIKGFDWTVLGAGTVVDVGGSAGQLSKRICAAAPDVTCIVQDLPSMVKIGEDELEHEWNGRISFMAHDFFEPQPVRAPSAFLLRFILHDWPDQDACKILRQLSLQMGPETRILINDSVMPELGATDPLTEKRIRNVDMMMMAMFNAKERSKEAWKALIAMADPTLRIANIVKPEGSGLSMIEVIKE